MVYDEFEELDTITLQKRQHDRILGTSSSIHFRWQLLSRISSETENTIYITSIDFHIES